MYRVKLTQTAADMFARLHPDTRKQIRAALRTLYETPYRGKHLQGELAHLRSLKMKRYRAVYHVNDAHQTIIVYAIGHRRDIYEIVK